MVIYFQHHTAKGFLFFQGMFFPRSLIAPSLISKLKQGTYTYLNKGLDVCSMYTLIFYNNAWHFASFNM